MNGSGLAESNEDFVSKKVGGSIPVPALPLCIVSFVAVLALKLEFRHMTFGAKFKHMKQLSGGGLREVCCSKGRKSNPLSV